MPSILDEILGGGIPDLEALRRAERDNSTRARQESIDRGLEHLDEVYIRLDDNDIDSRCLQLLLQGLRCIMKASHEDILNAADDADPDRPHLSEPIREMLKDAMAAGLEMTERIVSVIDIRENAVAGFKEQMRTPSYAEQREADAAEPTDG